MDEDYTLDNMGDKEKLIPERTFKDKKVEELKPNLRKVNKK